MRRIAGWMVERPGARMALAERDVEPGPDEVLVQVAGCGVCHTDLAFFYDGVPTRHPLPLTLGHEVSGTVIEAGLGAEHWLDHPVVVPAVIPCGRCLACRAGRATICPMQVFPGSDVHGGFATHVVVPAHGLCSVPDLGDAAANPHGLDLPTLSVIADAVSTPFEAVARSGLAAGDLAVFVGVGGVGGFGVQIAAGLGARVAAIDVSGPRLALLAAHGADLTLDASHLDFKSLRSALQVFADDHQIPSWRWKIFETSGTTAGQATAFGLIGKGSHLAVVGYSPNRVELRLSNLMAFDAVAQGNWGCAPERYPAILDLVLRGTIALRPFVEQHALGTINDVFADLHARRVSRRVVLVPEH
jgi:6-hydroxycyclohex-1-ene-1-carbonyl-CoA dehydrogenase